MAASGGLLAWMLLALNCLWLTPARGRPAEFPPRVALVILFAMCGIIGSALLFKASGWGRRIVGLIALLTAVISMWQIHLDLPLWLGGRLFIEREMLICSGVALFCLLTIVLLHPPWNRDSKLKPGASWLPGPALLVVFAAVACWMLRPIQEPELPFAHDSRFVITKLPLTGIKHYSVSPSGVTKCSIHGFLSQCTEVSGVHYVIAKEVAAGLVGFGNTNTLTAPQFVQAFTQALQTNQPEWIDLLAGVRRKENLVLVTNDTKTVLVLPVAMARAFQR